MNRTISRPANTKHLYSICTTPAQRLRRCNIAQVLYKCFVFTGQLCTYRLHRIRVTSWGSRVVLSEAVDWCIWFTRKIQHGDYWEQSRPQGPKNVQNCLMTVRPVSWACGHGTEMLLVLKNTFFDLITPQYFLIWQSKEMSHHFVRGQSEGLLLRVGNLLVRWIRWHCPPDTGFKFKPWHLRPSTLPLSHLALTAWGSTLIVTIWRL